MDNTGRGRDAGSQAFAGSGRCGDRRSRFRGPGFCGTAVASCRGTRSLALFGRLDRSGECAAAHSRQRAGERLRSQPQPDQHPNAAGDVAEQRHHVFARHARSCGRAGRADAARDREALFFGATGRHVHQYDRGAGHAHHRGRRRAGFARGGAGGREGGRPAPPRRSRCRRATRRGATISPGRGR